MRELRERMGLSMWEVYDLTRGTATSRRNTDYLVQPSRLSDIERKGMTPNLYRLHALSLVYACPLKRLLRFYGIADGRTRT